MIVFVDNSTKPTNCRLNKHTIHGTIARETCHDLKEKTLVIRLLLADDHKMFREGIKSLLADFPGIKVVSEACCSAEVIDCVRQEDFDVAILDLSMPGRDGTELIDHVKAMKPDLPILVLTMYSEEAYASRALRAGASGYMTKDCAAEQLVSAIEKIAAGGEYISPNVAERLALQLTRHKSDVDLPHTLLSNREYKIFDMLVQGKTVSAIANDLNLSSKTVSTHKARLLKKMNLNNQTELVRYTIDHKLSPL
jgi:DNA-binding NarL/FixJ family response regulator